MDVLNILATVGSALLALGAPGLPLVLALRLRPLTAAVATVPASLLMIAVAAELGHLIGLHWSIAWPLALGLLAGAALWPLGRRRPAMASAPDAPDADPDAPTGFLGTARGRAAAVLTGLVLGGGILLARVLPMMGGIDAISQTYDNVYHLNAVRHILRLHDASAWVVGGMTAMPGESVYYPAAWHQAVSLVVEVSGQDIPLASNVVMLLLAAVVWPLGLMALMRTATTAGPVGWMAAGTLAGVTGAFPLSLMYWGIVLPYFLTMVLMPLVIIGLAHVAGLAPSSAQRLGTGQLAVLLPVTGAAVALAHPQGVFSAMVLGLPILVWGTVSRARERFSAARVPGHRLWPLAVLTVVGIAVSSDLWTRFRPVQSSAVWKPNASVKEAVGQAISLAPNATPSFVPMGAVMLVCAAAVLLLSRSRWLLAPWIAASVASVVTRSTPEGDLRYLLTGNWYTDNNRVTALIAVAAIPVLALGIESLQRWAGRRMPRLAGLPGQAAAGTAAVLVLVLALISPGSRVNQGYFENDWQSGVLLTSDERELLEQLPEVVPEDAVIATNAWNGSSLAYALSDRQVLNTYMSFQAEPEVHLLNGRLDEATTNPEVCDAAEDLHVDYALDFGPQELHERSATYTGLNEISETGAAEVVLQVGDAKLLRMLPCRGTDGSMNP
ncbi:DUF6541 family protein [Brachybacterium ginsengisoli]|uniref:DUF6541 family protein n=1 Tax=Brachybacterium ginsengisoli TaxID=1331682 RepID=UPI00125EB6EC|nr:DUF6541 family protein [Brachybacterium ginsengisoli]